MGQHLTETFDNIIDSLCGDVQHTPLAVAVSGGADSLALVFLLKRWADKTGKTILALTVDHALRPESNQEALIVAKLLKSHHIDHHILAWEHPPVRHNIQAQARDARYQLMCSWCADHNIPILMTAHHRDDQAETVLSRLFRGSGVTGMAGIPVESTRYGIRIIRPLLGIPKQQLSHYLSENQISWIEDPSNENLHYDRVKIRKLLTHLEPDLQVSTGLIKSRLADHARHMGRVKDYLEQQTVMALKPAEFNHEFGFASISNSHWLSLHLEIQYRVISSLLNQVSHQEIAPRFDSLERLCHSFANASALQATLHGCIVYRHKDTLYIIREPAAIASVSIDIPTPIQWDNRFHLDLASISSTDLAESNMAIHPLWLYRKAIPLTAMESLTSLRITPSNRLNQLIFSGLPVLTALEKIVAIPHIGYYDSFLNKENTVFQVASL
ncbi:MAG: tRNA lysidine(34) synthetase TilS [Alphaproteobacteria bacterium]|nr:tRNA lysidine(34) synthetase TilS [Alphaproteobacteria bacterium]